MRKIRLIVTDASPLALYFALSFSHGNMQSRVKQEANLREYLCTSSWKRKDKNFSATGKRECSLCYFDLFLSAAYCPCSAARYSCLNHAKQLCSCTWTEKIFLFKYEISELNILVEALEGKLSAVYRWAREDLNLGLRHYISKENTCTNDKEQKEHRFQDAVTSYGNGSTAASSIKAEIKARLQQSQYLNKQKSRETSASSIKAEVKARMQQSQYLNQQKSKETTVSTPLPSVTRDDTSFLHGEVMSEPSSCSESLSSSSEEIADLDLNDGRKGCILSTSSSRSPPQREVELSKFLEDISSKHSNAKHFRQASEGLPMSHPASKKRKKK